jgi:hypothetical protein
VKFYQCYVDKKKLKNVRIYLSKQYPTGTFQEVKIVSVLLKGNVKQKPQSGT